jgi:hypothetical protein
MHALEGLANSDRAILDDDTEFFPFISALWRRFTERNCVYWSGMNSFSDAAAKPPPTPTFTL